MADAHTAVFQLLAGNTAVGYIVLSITAQILVLVSIVTMALDSQQRSLHDLIADTRVVRSDRNIDAADPSIATGSAAPDE